MKGSNADDPYQILQTKISKNERSVSSKHNEEDINPIVQIKEKNITLPIVRRHKKEDTIQQIFKLNIFGKKDVSRLFQENYVKQQKLQGRSSSQEPKLEANLPSIGQTKSRSAKLKEFFQVQKPNERSDEELEILQKFLHKKKNLDVVEDFERKHRYTLNKKEADLLHSSAEGKEKIVQIFRKPQSSYRSRIFKLNCQGPVFEQNLKQQKIAFEEQKEKLYLKSLKTFAPPKDSSNRPSIVIEDCLDDIKKSIPREKEESKKSEIPKQLPSLRSSYTVSNKLPPQKESESISADEDEDQNSEEESSEDEKDADFSSVSLESEEEETDSKGDIDQVLADICHEVKNTLFPPNKDKQEYFFEALKNSEKIQDLLEYFDYDDDNVQTQMITAQNEKNLFPRQLLIQLDKDEKKIELQNKLIGDKYMPALCIALTSSRYSKVKSLNLSNNNLQCKGIKHLVENFPENTKELILKDNYLGFEGAQLIKELCENVYFNLKTINLDGTKLRDRGAIELLDGLQNSPKIKSINISRNELTDGISETIFTYLSQAKNIEVLYLHWNQLKGYTGYQIARAIQRNLSIKVIDLSYNSIGYSLEIGCIEQWCITLKTPKVELCHLDLSYNSLTMNELKLLEEAIIDNQTLFGLHIEGNQFGCVMDTKGYIKLVEKIHDSDQIILKESDKQRIESVQYLPQKNPFDPATLAITNCCWICQGWQEVLFQYDYDPENGLGTGPIFLHLDFEGFTPILMEEDERRIVNCHERWRRLQRPEIQAKLIYECNDHYLNTFDLQAQLRKIENTQTNKDHNKRVWYLKKMCPPSSRLYYFYSNPFKKMQVISQKQPSAKVPEIIWRQCLNPQFQNDRSNLFFEFFDGRSVPFQILEYMNYIDTKQNFVLDDKNDYAPLVDCQPRDRERKFLLSKKLNLMRKRKEKLLTWTFEASFFNEQISDTEQLLDKAFEFDLSQTKISRIVKVDYDREKLTSYMRGYYAIIKNNFKIHASQSIFSGHEVFCLPFDAFTKMIKSTGIVDNAFLKNGDIEHELIHVKNEVDPNILYNPERALTRNQYLEVLFRLCNDKYVRSGICKSFPDAFYRLLNDGLINYFKQYELPQEWREERLQNRMCDLLIRIKQPYLQKLFDYTSEITNKKWYFRNRWVSVKEFQCLIQKSDLISEFLTEKDILLIFSLSMTTQVDELNEDRHMRMNFHEFIEGLARLAERISPVPLGEQYIKWSLPSKQSLPLHVKLETLLTFLYQRHPVPEKEQFADRFSSENTSASIPTLKFVNQFKESDSFNLTIQEDEKTVIQALEQLPQFDPSEINKRLISITCPLKFLKLFQTPYIPPYYKTFLNKNSLAHQRAVPTSKKKNSQIQKNKKSILQEHKNDNQEEQTVKYSQQPQKRKPRQNLMKR